MISGSLKQITWGGWVRTYGGSSSEVVRSVVQTSDGGYVIAGQTKSFGAGGYDCWLVKANSQGNKEWSKTFGSFDWELAESVVQTSDGGYAIAGDTWSHKPMEYNFLLVKTDYQGNEEWTKTYGGDFYEEALSVIRTADRGYAVAGTTGSYGASELDAWLIKLSGERSSEKGGRTGGLPFTWTISVVIGIVVIAIIVGIMMVEDALEKILAVFKTREPGD